MKPKTPFVQPFSGLPEALPIHALNNALLPGGELPLEVSRPADLASCIEALRSDQLIGIAQFQPNRSDESIYLTGCAGRIRQYRERKDGRLNLMLSGVCRFRIIDQTTTAAGYRRAKVDWSDFRHDYEVEEIEESTVDAFKAKLRHYFDIHNMQVDWKVLRERPVEEVVNNLVLVINFGVEEKQRLLEALTLRKRLEVFSQILDQQADPMLATARSSRMVN